MEKTKPQRTKKTKKVKKVDFHQHFPKWYWALRVPTKAYADMVLKKGQPKSSPAQIHNIHRLPALPR